MLVSLGHDIICDQLESPRGNRSGGVRPLSVSQVGVEPPLLTMLVHWKVGGAAHIWRVGDCYKIFLVHALFLSPPLPPISFYVPKVAPKPWYMHFEAPKSPPWNILSSLKPGPGQARRNRCQTRSSIATGSFLATAAASIARFLASTRHPSADYLGLYITNTLTSTGYSNPGPRRPDVALMCFARTHPKYLAALLDFEGAGGPSQHEW